MDAPIFALQSGDSPLIISFPHSGECLPTELAERMTAQGRAVPDTDWHVPKLYDFACALGVTTIQANYSRYVVDLNRPVDGTPLYQGQSETQLCPTTTFVDDPIYLPGQEPKAEEIHTRIEQFYKPYHQRLAAEINRIRERHGFALLWDAHSIQSVLPRFFKGTLPNLNLGTADGQSCDPKLTAQLGKILSESGFETIVNGRFKGGYITRHYGNPSGDPSGGLSGNIHAVQMEISQRTYMSEYPDFVYHHQLAEKLKNLLETMVGVMLAFVPTSG